MSEIYSDKDNGTDEPSCGYNNTIDAWLASFTAAWREEVRERKLHPHDIEGAERHLDAFAEKSTEFIGKSSAHVRDLLKSVLTHECLEYWEEYVQALQMRTYNDDLYEPTYNDAQFGYRVYEKIENWWPKNNRKVN